tara:strand:+ start:706 stop:2025 length:1320 start_codon:yes stop_codon:yes gene_type:complete
MLLPFKYREIAILCRKRQDCGTNSSTMALPLENLRVVEVASFLAAPSAAALMADMGAEVIKVEPPDGDTFRGNRTHLHKGRSINYVFEVDNRGKQSIAVDLNKPKAREVVHQLVSTADVFITNLTSDRTAKYSLDYETLRTVKPDIVYGHLVGYSGSGPEAERPGFDSTAFWARSGVMSLMGEMGGPAVQSRPGQGDHPTGVNLLAAILAALRLRDQTGMAQKAEVSLLRTGLWTIATDMQQALNLPGHTPQQFNRATHALLIRSAYETKDGRWIMLTMHNVPRYWPSLCKALGRNDWASDERFISNAAMLEHGPEIVEELQKEFRSQDLEHWARMLDQTGCIWAAAASLDEVTEDPLLASQGAIQTLQDVDGTDYKIVSTPFNIEGADIKPKRRAPLVGEHNHQVLKEAGFSDDDIGNLAVEGIFAAGTDNENSFFDR